MFSVESAASGEVFCRPGAGAKGEDLTAVATDTDMPCSTVGGLVEDDRDVLGHITPTFEFVPPATYVARLAAG